LKLLCSPEGARQALDNGNIVSTRVERHRVWRGCAERQGSQRRTDGRTRWVHEFMADDCHLSTTVSPWLLLEHWPVWPPSQSVATDATR